MRGVLLLLSTGGGSKLPGLRGVNVQAVLRLLSLQRTEKVMNLTQFLQFANANMFVEI